MTPQNGDIAVIYRPGIAAWLQGLYAKKYHEGQIPASHGFFFKSPTLISEADGLSIHESPLSKYQKAGIKIWVFRYGYLVPSQLDIMNTYVEASEAGDARYSWDGICDFVKSYFTGKRTFNDPKGEFCTDYTGQIIKAAGIPYSLTLPWEIDPTTQLNWLLTEGKLNGWTQIN